ncbi:MAG: hypothetical protein M3541_11585 [Acidobacteriota bacterium]|nr:hypothetical protein [Acidobacteriota bacterium]
MHVHQQCIVHAVEFDRRADRRDDDARAAQDGCLMSADAIDALEGQRDGGSVPGIRYGHEGSREYDDDGCRQSGAEARAHR